jgi:hypothetical protein
MVAPTSGMKVSSNYQGKVGLAVEGEHPNDLLIEVQTFHEGHHSMNFGIPMYDHVSLLSLNN